MIDDYRLMIDDSCKTFINRPLPILALIGENSK